MVPLKHVRVGDLVRIVLRGRNRYGNVDAVRVGIFLGHCTINQPMLVDIPGVTMFISGKPATYFTSSIVEATVLSILD